MLSFWEQQSFLEYDYIIVGSGIVGLSAAITLKENHPQASVLVLEQGIFPTGASTKNAGFGCFGSVTELLADIEVMGEREVLKLVEQRWSGLQKLQNRLGADAIGRKNFGGAELLLKGEKYEALNANALEKIEYINDLLCPLFGNEKVFEKLPDSKITELGFDTHQVAHLIFNPYEFQIHTGNMMRSLLQCATQKGVEIVNGCKVTAIEDTGGQVEINTSGHLSQQEVVFTASKTAVCTNAFTQKLLPELDIKPGRGIVLVTAPVANLKFKGTYHFDQGYYYFRNFGNRVIFGGGRNLDFEGEATASFELNQQIAKHLKEKLGSVILPQQNFVVEHTWAGIMAFGQSGKRPILKNVSENIVIGTRLNGMGVALGSTIGGEVAAKLEQ
ncbi:FAD-binding oxidoreductase [uncultured Microscilla sp.]|uniref:NAD(P)/FAD-dependent oxidoreductase n=1 Tax=uncultured Microscilla sp. TaxID=432653 RepID=UPI0026038D1B|nr:FAD-dependent oxidoreductase [uncultured Microscilla sp.]